LNPENHFHDITSQMKESFLDRLVICAHLRNPWFQLPLLG